MVILINLSLEVFIIIATFKRMLVTLNRLTPAIVSSVPGEQIHYTVGWLQKFYKPTGFRNVWGNIFYALIVEI